MLSLQDILMLFNAALLEQKIIVVSKNLGLLSKLVYVSATYTWLPLPLDR